MSTQSTMQAASQASPEPEAGQIRMGDTLVPEVSPKPEAGQTRRERTLVPENGDGSCWVDGCDSLNGNGKRPLEEDSREKMMADIAFLHGRNEVLRNMRDGLENGTVKDTGTKASIQSLTDDIAHNEERIARLEDALQQEDALWKEKRRKIEEKEKKDIQDVKDHLLTPNVSGQVVHDFVQVLDGRALVQYVRDNADKPDVQRILQGVRDCNFPLIMDACSESALAFKRATDAWLQADEAGDKAEATRLERLQEQANDLDCLCGAAYDVLLGKTDSEEDD